VWTWDARDSGVVEPVPNGRAIRSHDSPLGRMDLFPSLHRADQCVPSLMASDSMSALQLQLLDNSDGVALAPQFLLSCDGAGRVGWSTALSGRTDCKLQSRRSTW